MTLINEGVRKDNTTWREHHDLQIYRPSTLH
ncbi:hypothetical protein COLO4_14576 [Corchorus olitorius]|uniref:Uncharacterized protein n=1 Tax=Corchorus olitorius TaxID=93759 RepID=A0A1R3JRI8_9ROSI|nr:hypothetical protein COLO4_14576 [Corchorus olitorius]